MALFDIPPLSPNMQIIKDFDIPTLIECFKASDIIIDESDIKIGYHTTSSSINKKPRLILSITDDIAVIDSYLDFLDVKHSLHKQKTITCDELLANFRTEKLKQLIK